MPLMYTFFRLDLLQSGLTSNPSRIAANQLYQTLGFERYETNLYKYYILHPKTNPPNILINPTQNTHNQYPGSA